MNEVSKDEPPSPCPRSPAAFLIGMDSRGHWVVKDSSGLHGGLFIDRVQAIKYALFENGHHPEDVMLVPGILELDIGGPPAVGPQVSEARAHGGGGS